jgi:hypothetical protein
MNTSSFPWTEAMKAKESDGDGSCRAAATTLFVLEVTPERPHERTKNPVC